MNNFQHPQSTFFDTLHSELVHATVLLDINDPEGARRCIEEVTSLMQQEITRLEQVAKSKVFSEPLQQTRLLWQSIDKIHTAALDASQGIASHETASAYALRATTEAMKQVPYPGEPAGQE